MKQLPYQHKYLFSEINWNKLSKETKENLLQGNSIICPTKAIKDRLQKGDTMAKNIKDMTIEELYEELAFWDFKIANATSWEASTMDVVNSSRTEVETEIQLRKYTERREAEFKARAEAAPAQPFMYPDYD